MDITNFINSRDIRDHHRKVGYKYNALEAAWLVYQCRDVNVKQKHEAWKWIIQSYWKKCWPRQYRGCTCLRD